MADINTELVRHLVNRYTHDPHLWCRDGCRDNEGHLCPGALAADLSGGQWAGKPGEEFGDWLHAEPEDDPSLVLHVIHAHHRGRRVLGTRMNLGKDLTLGKLERLLNT